MLYEVITFDLGIAVAEIARSSGNETTELQSVEKDFNAVNVILAELLEDVQRRLATVSPWMGVLDRLGGSSDEAIVNFSMQMQ